MLLSQLVRSNEAVLVVVDDVIISYNRNDGNEILGHDNVNKQVRISVVNLQLIATHLIIGYE